MDILYRIVCFGDGTFQPQYAEPIKGLDGKLSHHQWFDFLTYFDSFEEAKKAMRRKINKQPPHFDAENTKIINIPLEELTLYRDKLI